VTGQWRRRNRATKCNLGVIVASTAAAKLGVTGMHSQRLSWHCGQAVFRWASTSVRHSHRAVRVPHSCEFLPPIIKVSHKVMNPCAPLELAASLANQVDDWNQRPFFMRFNTELRAEREAAFRQRCEKLEVHGSFYLAAEDLKATVPCGQHSPKYPELFANPRPTSC